VAPSTLFDASLFKLSQSRLVRLSFCAGALALPPFFTILTTACGLLWITDREPLARGLRADGHGVPMRNVFGVCGV
jgi:hypothetical protein